MSERNPKMSATFWFSWSPGKSFVAPTEKQWPIAQKPLILVKTNSLTSWLRTFFFFQISAEFGRSFVVFFPPPALNLLFVALVSNCRFLSSTWAHLNQDSVDKWWTHLSYRSNLSQIGWLKHCFASLWFIKNPDKRLLPVLDPKGGRTPPEDRFMVKQWTGWADLCEGSKQAGSTHVLKRCATRAAVTEEFLEPGFLQGHRNFFRSDKEGKDQDPEKDKCQLW